MISTDPCAVALCRTCFSLLPLTAWVCGARLLVPEQTVGIHGHCWVSDGGMGPDACLLDLVSAEMAPTLGTQRHTLVEDVCIDPFTD